MAAPLRVGLQRFGCGHPAFRSIICLRTYAKKLVGKVGGAAAQKQRMEVENDPEKLLSFCCGANIFVDGKDPEIKPDSEYPDWLWNLRTERGGQDLSELDPETMAYWRRLTRLSAQRNERVAKRIEKLRAIHYPDDYFG